MDRLVATRIVKGLATYVPGYLSWHDKHRAQAPGSTLDPEYCYSVWLRHLVMADQSGLDTAPASIGELGPGASVGVGICALLTGSDAYYGLDAGDFADRELSAALIPDLVDMFRRRAAIPGEGSHKPVLASCEFPAHILTDDRLAASLTDRRVAAIRSAVLEGRGDGISVRYVAPWDDPTIVPAETLDMIVSQAVLEHVDDIGAVYAAMYLWLKPGGFMSHQIDYRSHDTATAWDGHWGHSDLKWQLIHGKRRKEINRLPHSRHIEEIARAGFTITREIRSEAPSTLGKERLAPRFRSLSDADRSCAGALVQAVKQGAEPVT